MDYTIFNIFNFQLPKSFKGTAMTRIEKGYYGCAVKCLWDNSATARKEIRKVIENLVSTQEYIRRKNTTAVLEFTIKFVNLPQKW